MGIGQPAIRSQFAREASRNLLSTSIASGDPCLTLPFLSHCFFVQYRAALRANGSRRCAKSHRSQRHLLHNTTFSTACLVSLSFSRMRKQEWVGEQRALRVSGARKHPSAIFPEVRSRAQVAGCSKLVDTARICVAGCSPCMRPFPTVYFALVRKTILRK